MTYAKPWSPSSMRITRSSTLDGARWPEQIRLIAEWVTLQRSANARMVRR